MLLYCRLRDLCCENSTRTFALLEDDAEGGSEVWSGIATSTVHKIFEFKCDQLY